jgi:hypothetical protein
VRQTAEGERPVAVSTLGHRSSTLGQEVAVDDRGACGMVGWAGGGQSVSIIDELIEEDAAAKGMLAPSIVAESSSSQWQHR